MGAGMIPPGGEPVDSDGMGLDAARLAGAGLDAAGLDATEGDAAGLDAGLAAARLDAAEGGAAGLDAGLAAAGLDAAAGDAAAGDAAEGDAAGLDAAGLDTGLTMLVSESHAREAARARTRERHLRNAAGADATLAGILVDLAEGGGDLVVRTTSGRTVRGRIVVVAHDAIALESESKQLSYVRLSGVAWVRHVGGATRSAEQPAGDRAPPRRASFASLLRDLAADRPRVALGIEGETAPLTGELRSAGTDVLTVRLDGEPPITAHVATDQLSVVTVLASG